VRAGRRPTSVLGAVLALIAPVALLLLAPGQASAASYRVTMKGYAFGPAALTVQVGDTVTWTNQDTAPHDVKTTSGPVSIHSPLLNKGQSWSFTFTTAGSYGYYCTVHPDMTARLVVQPAATSAAPTHTHAPTQAGSAQHGTGGGQPSATAAPTARKPTPTPTPTSSRTATHSAAAAPSTSAAAAPAPGTTAAGPADPQAQSAAGAPVRPLEPLLVLAGLVAGVAVLCLLLVGSRASHASDEGATDC
jgi:amicyanin